MKSIKANEVRVGDSIRTSTTIDGIKTTKELQVSTITSLGLVISFETKEFGEVFHSRVSDVELVDRPAPKLPTKPGSLIWIKGFLAEPVEPPILAFCSFLKEWHGNRRFPDGTTYARSTEITEWEPAVTVAEATP